MTKVLVVDDSPIDRKLTTNVLVKGTDWSVVEAIHGLDALAKLGEGPFDVVVTDMQMPEMNGLELVAAVKRDHPHLPTVLVTARGSEEIAVQALELGAASYVPKKRLARDLHETVERVLRSADEMRTQSTLATRLVEQSATFQSESELSVLLAIASELQRTVAGCWQCEHTVQLQLGTALEEAIVNAVHHGNLELDSELRDEDYSQYYKLAAHRAQQSPYKERAVTLTARIDRERAEFVVADEGPGFDPTSLPDPTDAANLDRPHGRGIMLMRTFMDDVTYNEAGNQVTLVKKRPSAS